MTKGKIRGKTKKKRKCLTRDFAGTLILEKLVQEQTLKLQRDKLPNIEEKQEKPTN